MLISQEVIDLQEQVIRNIEYVGLKDSEIDSFTFSDIETIIETHLGKIEKIVGEETHLKVHIKPHFPKNSEKVHKYSVKMHLTFRNNKLSMGNVSAWDIRDAVLSAMKDLDTRVKKLMKV